MVNEQTSSSSPSSHQTSVPTSKALKPRAGVQRKTKAEREQYAKEEADRQQARLRANENVDGLNRPSSAGSNVGRSRANPTVNRADRVRTDGTGSGVFGGGATPKSVTKPIGVLVSGFGESERLDRKTQLEEEGPEKNDESRTIQKTIEKINNITSEGTGPKTARKSRDSIRISSSDETDEPGRDIEMIWISSDEDDQDIIGIEGKRKNLLRPPKTGMGLRPVRAPRTEVEEQEEIAFAGIQSKRLTKRSGEGEIIDIDNDEMVVDEPELLKEPSSNLEQKKKHSKRVGGRNKDAKATETVEERSERLRLNVDIQKLRKEFLNTNSVDETTTQYDNDTTEESSENHTNRKLFLFQFPPMIPFLTNPATAQGSGTEVKTEPNLDSSSTTTALPEIKKDPDAPNISQSTIPSSGVLTATSQQRLPTGYVGKFKVHKSGKITLDWGGTDMEIRYGTEVDFLQDAVLVQSKSTEQPPPPNINTQSQNQDQAEREDGSGEVMTNPDSDKGKSKSKEMIIDNNDDDDDDVDTEKINSTLSSTGTAYALGQVRKKMVVIPDWSKLYD